jgi:Protein of unknown function (DUF642)
MARVLFLGCAVGMIGGLAAIPVASLAVTRRHVSGPAVGHYAKTFCPSWSGGTGILENGDFSQTQYPGSYIGYPGGGNLGPGWKVKGRSVDLVGYYWPSPNGICTVDLDGSYPVGVGGIEHKAFATTPSAVYTVSFMFSGNGDYTCNPDFPVKVMEVSAASQSQQFTWDVTGGNDAEHGLYLPQVWQFTATGSKTKLSFVSRDKKKTRNNCGPVIAAISVTQN